MNKPKPDRKKALWHLDAATNLNPKFVEAIELKQQLTGRGGDAGRTAARSAAFVRRADHRRPSPPATQPTDEPPAPQPRRRPTRSPTTVDERRRRSRRRDADAGR